MILKPISGEEPLINRRYYLYGPYGAKKKEVICDVITERRIYIAPA
jgi:hypothetical protein